MAEELPKGWERITNAMVCLPVIYENERTGEVRYDKPKSESMLARSLPTAVLFREYDHRFETLASGPPETRPRDWKKIEDAQEVLTAYYQNVLTGKTCYDAPKSSEAIAQSLSNAALNRETNRRGRPRRRPWRTR